MTKFVILRETSFSSGTAKLELGNEIKIITGSHEAIEAEVDMTGNIAAMVGNGREVVGNGREVVGNGREAVGNVREA
ncbi:MAG: hypothetical protein HC899_21055, partial [Leptolyngbyaceae cyanobacterium SM1_4_3]|nr:hypothetical protein [Leptolyngbyaceae cyanobacterium SM1_4_3]